MTETPYTETEALLAVMNGDYERLKFLLDGMLPNELAALTRNSDRLAVECGEAILRSRERHPLHDSDDNGIT